MSVFSGESGRRDDTRSAIDSERRDPYDRPKNYDGAVWKMKEAGGSADDKGGSDLRIFQGFAGFAATPYRVDRDLRKLLDRSKRSSRRSTVGESNNRTSEAVRVTEGATRAHPPERIVSEDPKTRSHDENGERRAETTPKDADRRIASADRADSIDLARNLSASNAPAASTTGLLTNRGAGDSRESAGNRGAGERSRAASRKPRHGADDERSRGAREEAPRGNTSRNLGNAATNESRDSVADAGTTAGAGEIGGAGATREESREPIPGAMIKAFEPEGRPRQKREAGTTARLSRGGAGEESGSGGTSVEKMRTGNVESRDANVESGLPCAPIDLAGNTTTIPNAATSGAGKLIAPTDRRDDPARTISKDDSREQQMVLSLIAGSSGNANKSNGNSDSDEIDIRGSSGNETMNVKGGIGGDVTGAGELREFDDNVRRKLLWISAISAKDADDSSMSAESRRTENMDRDRQRSEVSSTSRIGVGRENSAESPAPRNDFNSRASDANRYKRSAYSLKNFESNDETYPENAAIEKEAAVNLEEKREGNEEYPNQNVEDAENYNREEEGKEKRANSQFNFRNSR